MPPRVDKVKWLTINLPYKLNAKVQRYGDKRDLSPSESIRNLITSALNNKVVEEHSEMKELLYLIREGVTKDNQDDVLKRVDKILEGY